MVRPTHTWMGGRGDFKYRIIESTWGEGRKEKEGKESEEKEHDNLLNIESSAEKDL